jgi:hypothetical protein
MAMGPRAVSLGANGRVCHLVHRQHRAVLVRELMQGLNGHGMTRLSLRQWTGDRKLFREGMAILLALAIGIGGLIFVFSIPDPFVSLAPHIPMLSPEDWPGSDGGRGVAISTGWSWREKREFHTGLVLSTGTSVAEISQMMIWYADPLGAAADWIRLDRSSYKEEPFVESGGGDGRPISMLFCGNRGMSLPEGFRECWYLAYWEHWFIEVNYRSQLAENLHVLEMQRIAARVDQLLMSAPDEPCYGILCMGTKNNIKP